jgi:hypothetical protein
MISKRVVRVRKVQRLFPIVHPLSVDKEVIRLLQEYMKLQK